MSPTIYLLIKNSRKILTINVIWKQGMTRYGADPTPRDCFSARIIIILPFNDCVHAADKSILSTIIF